MAQCYDMPVHAFESQAKFDNLISARRVGDSVHAVEIFTGKQARDVHEAMDARLKDIEAVGGSVTHRTRIGRNTPCPCGSGLKFKKCCVGKAFIAG